MQVQVLDYSPDANNSNKKNPLMPKIIVGLAATLIIINVAVLSFLIGRNSSTNNSSEKTDIGAQFKTPEALGAETGSNDNNHQDNDTNTDEDTKISTTPTPTRIPVKNEIILTAVPELDGFRTSSGYGSSLSGIQIGRNKELVSRGFLTFDLSKLPDDTNILEAKLRVFVVKEEGFPARLGDLMVDHLRYGDSLDANDYSTVAILSSFTQMQEESKNKNWFSADVTNAVINDLDSTRSDSQFRLHFKNEVKTDSEDFYYLESAENYLKSDNLPELQITYYKE